MSEEMQCSLATKKSNENIITSAANIDVQIAIELAEPWDAIPLKSKYFPTELLALAPTLAKAKINCGINYFVNNSSASLNSRKVFIFKKLENEFLPYEKFVLEVPNNQLENFPTLLLQLLLHSDKEILKWQTEKIHHFIELFICTHGLRDQCCGIYGNQLYEEFKETIFKSNNKDFRIWKSSHIGGHRYAPTFFEAPNMRWYGLFDLNSIETFLDRKQNDFKIKNNYRGMSGINNKFAALVENELFKEYSWEWLSFTNKSYEVFSNHNVTAHSVHFFYTNQTQKFKRVFQVVETDGIENLASCGSLDKKFVKQYKVTECV